MTIHIETSPFAPQVIGDYESVLKHKSMIEANLALLDAHLHKLSRQKEQLLRQRTLLVQQAEKFHMMKSPVSKLPVESIVPFLSAVDVCNLRASSRLFQQKCVSSEGQLLVSHLVTPSGDLSVEEAFHMIDSLCLPMVETLYIDAKKPSGRALMEAIACRGSEFTSLVSLRISAAAQTGSFLKNVFTFVCALRPHQLTSLHLSGFLTIRHVATILKNQTLSMEKFQVDYFVNGHETDIESDFIPVMPNLRSLVYDVADVTEVSVDLLMDRLSRIERKDLMEAIYLPHVQITGDSQRIKELVQLVKEFNKVDQLVVRFRHLPLSVREIVGLREAFSALPACCISDHFVVVQRNWCSWWPSLPEVWDRPDKITGLSVFREQIDFESLGSSATREWLKLTSEQKNLWSTTIASQVMDLYLRNSPAGRDAAASIRGNSSVRAASV